MKKLEFILTYYLPASGLLLNKLLMNDHHSFIRFHLFISPLYFLMARFFSSLLSLMFQQNYGKKKKPSSQLYEVSKVSRHTDLGIHYYCTSVFFFFFHFGIYCDSVDITKLLPPLY